MKQSLENLITKLKKIGLLDPPNINLSRVNDHKKLYVIIEGAGGYAPRLFYLAQLFELYSLKKIYNQLDLDSEMLKIVIPKISSPYTMANFLELADSDDATALYYSYKHKDRIAFDIQEIIEGNPDLEIHLIGWSMGARAAHYVADKLVDTKFKRLLTIDYIPHFPGVIPHILKKNKNLKAVKCHNVEIWENYYQDCDENSLTIAGVSIPLRGMSIDNADINTLLNDFEHKNKAHIEILKSDIIKKNL